MAELAVVVRDGIHLAAEHAGDLGVARLVVFLKGLGKLGQEAHAVADLEIVVDGELDVLFPALAVLAVDGDAPLIAGAAGAARGASDVAVVLFVRHRALEGLCELLFEQCDQRGDRDDHRDQQPGAERGEKLHLVGDRAVDRKTDQRQHDQKGEGDAHGAPLLFQRKHDAVAFQLSRITRREAHHTVVIAVKAVFALRRARFEGGAAASAESGAGVYFRAAVWTKHKNSSFFYFETGKLCFYYTESARIGNR